MAQPTLLLYAVVAVDASGLIGRISNIVPVYIYEPPPPPTTTTVSPALPVESSDYSDGGLNATVPIRHVGGLTEHQLYAVAGGVAGFVVLLVVLSVTACLCRKRRAKPGNKSTTNKTAIQVEPMKRSLPDVSMVNNNRRNKAEVGLPSSGSAGSGSDDRPVYKIYVNNAYIQEEDGELKIVTPDGRVISSSSGHNTLPRGRSASHHLDRTPTFISGGVGSADHHWSLPRTIKSPASQRASKVLTNGSIMHSGSQGALTSGSTSLINAAINASGSGTPFPFLCLSVLLLFLFTLDS